MGLDSLAMVFRQEAMGLDSVAVPPQNEATSAILLKNQKSLRIGIKQTYIKKMKNHRPRKSQSIFSIEELQEHLPFLGRTAVIYFHDGVVRKIFMRTFK